MSNYRKPYVKQILNTRFVVIFTQESNIFVEHVIAFCNANRIDFRKEVSKTGRIKFKLDYCDYHSANKLKSFIRNDYEEFHHYNKEIKRRIKTDRLV